MGTYFWATWLADALRKDQFVADRMIEVPGWQTRGRPPAEFSFLPSGVLDHHTACMIREGHDPQSDLNVIINGRSDVPGPISQLLGTWTPPGTRWNGSNVSPRIIVVAAGRSNHAGVGIYPWGAPSGNGSSIGIEWCGPPETVDWPDEVIELRERVDACILRHNGWGIHQLTTHWEYGTPSGRKIDPSGPYIGEPHLAWNQHWDPATWRTRVAQRMMAPPHTPPVITTPPTDIILEDSTMKVINHRAYDSRALAQPLQSGETRMINLGLGGPAAAAMVNLTVVNAEAEGFMSAWGAGQRPETSVINYKVGATIANGAIIPVVGGAITLFASGRTHVNVDVQATWE